MMSCHDQLAHIINLYPYFGSTMGDDSTWSRKAKDTFAGFVGGAVQVLVGQPFDLVKVRMQTGHNNSVTGVIHETLKNEGLTAFYKGTTAPLIGVGLCVSIQFYGFHEAKRQFLKSKGGPLSPSQIFACGGIAGLLNTIATTPIEHVRILVQTQKTMKYLGPFDAARTILKENGLPGLYRGNYITMLREFQAYGTWFLTYEYLISCEVRSGVDRSAIPTYKLMLFGALAGEALWITSYPLDVVKSKIQSDGFGSEKKYRDTRDVILEIWRRNGLKGFWKGLTPTLLRALPASASTFASVELALRFLT